jgi:hypothetical protein
MQSVPLLDCAGRPRSPATLASFHAGHPRWAALVVAGHRRRGATVACGVENEGFHHSTSS